MGYAMDTFFRQYNADVSRDDLTVTFLRLFEDVRDEMSDCVKPDWMPLDDFIIEVVGYDFKVEHIKEPEYVLSRKVYEKIGEFEVRTRDKRVANWIWYLSERKGLSFGELEDMYNAGKFNS